MEEEDTDRASQVVSQVIHEYDIIDSHPELPTNENQQGEMSDTNIQMKDSTNNIDNQIENEEDDFQIDFTCPNCPEHIIICLDLSEEMSRFTFRSRAGDKLSPLQLIKRALKMFLFSKSRINKKHQYSLMILHDTATWVRSLSNNPRDIISLLDDVEETKECDSFDLSSVFDAIQAHDEFLLAEADQSPLPPPYVVRVILLLGRSHTSVQHVEKQAFNTLDSSPYFFCDALYIHEPPSEDNQCEAIFDTICDLDVKGQSYIFEASRNPTKVYDQMAKLLAHPLQRPLQKDIAHRLHNQADFGLPQTDQT